MWDWLTSPIDASRGHDVGVLLAFHARAMVLAWGIAVPVGIVAARFFKVLPWQDWPRQVDSRVWWNTHRLAQYGALALMALGLVLVLVDDRGAASPTPAIWQHRVFGYTALALGAGQALSAWLRGSKGGPTDPRGRIRGDHYDMTRRRLIFERVHKRVGYLAFALAMAAILTGLWQVNAPGWMWLTICVWWAGLIWLAGRLHRRQPAVSTYAAIWGPDPIHPGNRSAAATDEAPRGR